MGGAEKFKLMSLTPVTRNFASVTRRVFRDRVVFSGGASSRRQNAFASGTRRREGAKTRKRSRLPSSAFLYAKNQ